MKFVCPVCGYVEEFDGDQLPEDFKCPQCGVPGSRFLKQEEGQLEWAAEHVVGVAKMEGVSEDIVADLRANFEGECSEVGMYLAMARVAHREGYPEIGVLQARRSAGDYWMAASSCGFPASWRGRVVMTRESSRALDRMAQGENRRTNIGINNGVETMHVRAEVQKYREHVTVMIETGDVLSGAARIDR